VFVKLGHACKTAKCRIKACISHITAAGTSRTRHFTDAYLYDLATIHIAALLPKRIFFHRTCASNLHPSILHNQSNQLHHKKRYILSIDISTMSQYFDNGRAACTSCLSQHQPALLLLCVILVQLACLIWGMWYVDAHFMPKGKD
jgi:hypothetical protein